jgi:cytochrome P450
VVAAEDLTPGGFGWTVLGAHKRGEIPVEAAVGLLAGYVVAAFDTTINAIASGTWLFATDPGQWDALRADPSLVPSAVNEIVRMESPIQHFSRVTTRDVDLGEGVVIPAGRRVLHSYASANRDERHYPAPDTFDVRRNPADHLAFSYGIHACAGQGLARMEAHAVFTALAARVRRIELDGEPVRALNNITRGFTHLPVRVS